MSAISLHTVLLIMAIAALAGCKPADRREINERKAPPSHEAQGPSDLAKGKAVFLRACASCHQANGAGVKGVFPPLTDRAIIGGDPVRLIRIVLHGLQGPVEVEGVRYDGVMPAHGASLKDHEIANLLTYMRRTWGGDAAVITREDVAAERAGTSRKTMWSWAELDRP